MVMRLIFTALLFPLFLFSEEFTASVNRNQAHVGDQFVLTLTLKDTAAKGAPSLEALRKSFSIHSQQQSSSTMIMNGKMSSSVSWKISLSSQKEGEVVIPSISVMTSQGVLATEPIKMTIVKGGFNRDASDSHDLILTTEISKKNPYKNEPFLFTVILTSKIDLVNVHVQKFQVEDAIVELAGEPKIYKRVSEGVRIDDIEFNYFITPLKEGLLKIPPITVEGQIPIKRKPSNMRSFFEDDFESFFMMTNLERLKPFSLLTDAAIVYSKPPAEEISPWIPAQSLTIEEIWDDSQILRVGEPLTRGFKITAEGVMSSQLPHLKDLQTSENQFKIYADNPQLAQEINEESIKSYRKEQYTLIPQQSGTLTLPEITVAWWDVNKNQKNCARVPSRTLKIQPEVIKAEEVSPQEEFLPTAENQAIPVVHRDPILYAFVLGLGILFLGALFWVISLQKKIVKLTGASIVENKPRKVSPPAVVAKKSTPKKSKQEKLPDLNPT